MPPTTSSRWIQGTYCWPPATGPPIPSLKKGSILASAPPLGERTTPVRVQTTRIEGAALLASASQATVTPAKAGATLFATVLYLPLYLQIVKGISPTANRRISRIDRIEHLLLALQPVFLVIRQQRVGVFHDRPMPWIEAFRVRGARAI